MFFLDSERSNRLDIPRAGTHRDGVRPAGNGPLLRHDVPVAHIASKQGEGDVGAGPSRDVHLLEATQDAARLVRLGGEREVQLGDLGAGAAPRVAHARGHADDLVPEVGLAAQGELAGRVLGRQGGGVGDGGGDGGRVVEGGVGEAVAEGVGDGQVLGVEVTVVKVDALGEVAFGGVTDADGVVIGGLGKGVGEFA